MPLALEITLIAVLAVLTACIVPLIFQLRRTAKGVDAFLLATRKDLVQITEDVHASRLRMDRLGNSLQAYLDDISGIMAVMRDVKEGVASFASGIRRALDPASNPFAGIVGGVSAIMTLFRRNETRKKTASAENPS